MADSSIEWTDKVWNPVTGCTKVSAGCANCYAATWAHRGMGQWKGRKFEDVRAHQDRLVIPLKWRKPYRVFVNSMSDLFHEDVPFEFIAEVFDTMASATLECKGNHPKHSADDDYEGECWTGDPHTFQVLTKRPARAKAFMDWLPDYVGDVFSGESPLSLAMEVDNWPLKNVWLGVSVENQKAADERIPLLMETPAAVRFLSVEPMLEKVYIPHAYRFKTGYREAAGQVYLGPALDWVICGGESGPKARPFNIEWARSLRDQCKEAGVAFFMKQLGAKCLVERPFAPGGNGTLVFAAKVKDRKGGDMAEWPEDLRIREFPV